MLRLLLLCQPLKSTMLISMDVREIVEGQVSDYRPGMSLQPDVIKFLNHRLLTVFMIA